jgi:hypothetical protein
MEETKRQAEEARRIEEMRKAEMARKAEEARKSAKLSVEGIVDVAVKSAGEVAGAAVDATMRKPSPPPMVFSDKTTKSASVVNRNDKISVAPPEQMTYTLSADDEYEIYEEYISFDEREEEEEVAPADFGRLSYIDLYDNNDDSDDDFVFSEAEEEKEDDGEFNYGVKVVRKRKRQGADAGGKAPVKDIVLTDENAPEVQPNIDGNAMLSLAEMKKRNNKNRF